MRISIAVFIPCLIVLLIGLSGCSSAENGQPDLDTLDADTSQVMLTGRNLLGVLEDDGRFSTFLAAFDSSGLGETINGTGPFTIFAPTDLAINRLTIMTPDELLSPANRLQLQDILMNHVINGRRTADEIRALPSVTSMYGEELAISENNGAIQVEGIDITEMDMQADNGIIHVVDDVILPEDSAADAPEPATSN